MMRKLRSSHPGMQKAIDILKSVPAAKINDVAKRFNIPTSTLQSAWSNERRRMKAEIELTEAINSIDKNKIPEQSDCSPWTGRTPSYSQEPTPKKVGSFFESDELLFDLETLPNEGYFFECYNDKRAIPLAFIRRPKAICTIAYKWRGADTAHVLVAKTPYEDGDVLQEFMPIWEKAKFTVAHYGSGFDEPFLAGRLLANGLPPLPPVTMVDTYKMARKHFGKTLNSNKLDYLGEIMGLGNKNKTDATLWVRCSQGDPEALKEMALYNVQDVNLLEKIYDRLRPYVKSKINMNLLTDDAVNRCKSCGSENLEHLGFEMTAATMRDRCKCKDCGHWSSFKAGK